MHKNHIRPGLTKALCLAESSTGPAPGCLLLRCSQGGQGWLGCQLWCPQKLQVAVGESCVLSVGPALRVTRVSRVGFCTPVWRDLLCVFHICLYGMCVCGGALTKCHICVQDTQSVQDRAQPSPQYNRPALPERLRYVRPVLDECLTFVHRGTVWTTEMLLTVQGDQGYNICSEGPALPGAPWEASERRSLSPERGRLPGKCVNSRNLLSGNREPLATASTLGA